MNQHSDANRPKLITIEELLAMKFPPRDSGNWIYQPDNLTLWNQKAGCEVDLETMTSSAEALDWILQIAAKYKEEWDLPGFVSAFKEAVFHRFGNSAQGVFCPFGQSMEVDWRRRTFKRAAPGLLPESSWSCAGGGESMEVKGQCES